MNKTEPETYGQKYRHYIDGDNNSVQGSERSEDLDSNRGVYRSAGNYGRGMMTESKPGSMQQLPIATNTNSININNSNNNNNNNNYSQNNYAHNNYASLG